MIESTVLLGLVDRIHAAGLDGAWEAALSGVVAAFRGETGCLAFHDLEARTARHVATVGIEPVFQRAYTAMMGSVDMPAVRHRLTDNLAAKATTDDLHAHDVGRWEASPLYTEYLRPQRMDRFVLAVLMPRPEQFAVLGVTRPVRAGAYDEEAMAAMRTLHPHLLRALQVRHRLAALEAARQQALEALDHVEQGMLLVGPDGTVLHANRAAEDLLRAGDGLRTTDRRVGCDDPRQTKALRWAIGEASLGTGTRCGGTLAIHRRSGARPLSILVAPLRGQEQLGLEPWATAIVLVSDPDQATPAQTDHLRQLYGLTPAEARTAVALLDADRLQDIADRSGVSLSAVRVHLQRVFEKTGTHRQAELVRLLLAHRLPGSDNLPRRR